VLSDIGTPSSLDVQQIADQRRTIIWRRSRARATESPPEIVPAPGISSQSQVRFRSGHLETGTAWCLPRCRAACCLFLPSIKRVVGQGQIAAMKAQDTSSSWFATSAMGIEPPTPAGLELQCLAARAHRPHQFRIRNDIAETQRDRTQAKPQQNQRSRSLFRRS
jgi:hypothetical protein